MYVHIHTSAYSQIAVWRCLGGESADVFWQQCEILSSRSAVMGHETGSPSLDMAWGTFLQSRGGAKGARDAFSGGEGGGRAKSGVQKCRLRREKMHAQMPWGALSGARWLPSIGNVFWGGGINSRVSGGHSRKYMQIRAIYKHIRRIHAYTCIYLHIRSAFVCVHISVSC